jgi:sugar phosphate isomerase/epimerase
MRIAGHTLGTPDQTVPEALALFREAGLDAAEVIYQDGYRSGLPLGDLAAAAEARAVADELDVPIAGLTPYTTGINHADPTLRLQALDELRGAFEIAHILGADRVRIYAGSWHPGDADHAGHWARLVESLAALAPEAADAGVTLCIENHFGTMTQTARDTAALVRELGTPSVRVLYDQANLAFTHDEDVDAAFAAQGDLIGHVHVKDLVFIDTDAAFVASETARVKAEERNVRSRIVGEGVLPWDRILAALLQSGYDDLLSLEYEYRWHPHDLVPPAEGFRRGAEHVRALLEAMAA